MICDLCKLGKRQTRYLCLSCGDSISRLMTVAQWESQRLRDKQLNLDQLKMLQAYSKAMAAGQ